MSENRKLPFKIICTNCNREVELVDEEFNKSIFAKRPIEVIGSPFYDSAIVEIECDCKNQIKL